MTESLVFSLLWVVVDDVNVALATDETHSSSGSLFSVVPGRLKTPGGIQLGHLVQLNTRGSLTRRSHRLTQTLNLYYSSHAPCILPPSKGKLSSYLVVATVRWDHRRRDTVV